MENKNIGPTDPWEAFAKETSGSHNLPDPDARDPYIPDFNAYACFIKFRTTVFTKDALSTAWGIARKLI